MEEGASGLLQAARIVSLEQNVEFVIAVEDARILRRLQNERTAAAHLWWCALDARAFQLLAETARSLADGRAAVLLGSGVTGRDPFGGFDERMRAVTNGFGLSGPVPSGHGTGRSLLETLIKKCREDETGGRWKVLGRLLDAAFGVPRHPLAAALAVSLPVGLVHALSPDGVLDAARLDVLFGPEVSELMGTYRDPESMSPLAADEVGLPTLDQTVARRVRAHPNACVFIGVERDAITFDELLDVMEEHVPGFGASPKTMLQHADAWAGQDESVWTGQFASIVARRGDRHERARAFEQLLDALVALTWAGGQGRFVEAKVTDGLLALPIVESTNTSVWAFNGGAPGSGRR
jgi:hypothetical protein